MEKKINVAGLLKDCPKGMELDCTLFENLEFDRIDKNNGTYPIICRVKTSFGGYNNHTFTEHGCYSAENYSKCVIFPKGKTTWEGFVPPCKFKDGDIVTYKLKGSLVAFIYKERISTMLVKSHFALYSNNMGFCVDSDIALKEEEIIFTTEEEKQKLFDAIKDNGYNWNDKTKTLEKLPRFKVGDRIRHKIHRQNPFVITEITEQSYKGGTQYEILIEQQDNFELVPNKFDINTLVPFESRVLVRDTEGEKWEPAIWGYYDVDHIEGYPYETIGGNCFCFCIPYEDNEHLLGTTDDCADFYKIW